LAELDTLTLEAQTALARIAAEGMAHAAEGFSGLLGETVHASRTTARLVPLAQIPLALGGPEDEAVGIYLRSEGDLMGRFMLVMPLAGAFELVDLLLGQPAGTAVELGRLERSALAEVGNLSSSYFLNRVAARLGRVARPTPPAVMVDMVAAILDVIAATGDCVSEHVILLQTEFKRGERAVPVTFWVIPEPGTLRLLMGQWE
jgi:chemotaxis protein CheC